MTFPRAALVFVCAAVLAVVALAGVSARGDAKPVAKKPPSRLLVRGFEWDLTLSRVKVRPGTAIVQFVNGGEDDHDLRIRKLNRRGRGVGRTVSFPDLRPGDLATKATKFRKGRYRLWCSLAGHAKLGMNAKLAVR